jgi:serine/threonine-protein kinase
MSGSNLLRELRRRHVWRVAVAYLITGWVLVQAASIVLPAFGAPPWVLRALLVLLGILFPVALILAWAFEITPEGVRRSVPEGTTAARPPEVARGVGRGLNVAIIAGLLVAVAVLAWGRFGPGHAASSASKAAASPPTSAASADSIPARSIAVLPFENLSTDSANAFFAGGMQDMILTKLAGLGDLKVIARTSTERYGSKPQDLRTVGRELGVAAVLEGSVQRSGNQVLINVQLINARTNGHLWAQYYTRTLDNVFGVEGEVAGKVADALQARLTPSERERVATPPTTNAAAYELYLKADAHFRRGTDNNARTAEEMPPAIRLYEQALARDSSFALAWAELARAHLAMYWFAPDRTAARLAAAKAAADRSLALQPDLGEGHQALAEYEYWGHRDYDAAVAQLELARQALPNSAQVEVNLAAILRRQGAMEKAVDAFERAALLDPRDPGPYVQLSLTYQMLRRYDAADSASERALAIDGDTLSNEDFEGWNAVYRSGDLEPIAAVLARVKPGSPYYALIWQERYWLAYLRRDFGAAVEAARSDTTTDWASSHNVVLPRLLYVGMAQERAGRTGPARESYAAARARVRTLLARRPDDADLHLALALAAAGLGRKDEALSEGRRALELMPVSRDAVTGPEFLVWMAWIDVQVGDKKAAIGLLGRLLDLPAGGLMSRARLRIDPTWDALRKEPAFQALTRQAPAAPPASSSSTTEPD